jgi:hypothetical protein
MERNKTQKSKQEQESQKKEDEGKKILSRYIIIILMGGK